MGDPSPSGLRAGTAIYARLLWAQVHGPRGALRDISITEPAIEDVIARLYAGAERKGPLLTPRR